MTVETPTLESLERQRSRQDATRRLLRPLGLAVVLIVEVTGVTSTPHPSLRGRGLGVTLALIVFAAGLLGATRRRVDHRAAGRDAILLILLVGSSAALVALQPDGPGFLGCFVAVSAATLRLSPARAIAVTVLALFGLGLAAATRGAAVGDVLLIDVGVCAFYVVSRLAQRLRQGQDQAMLMVAELERSRDAQAEAAALAERQRLAREMHDVLAHSLSGLVLQLEGARLLAMREQPGSELASAVDRALHLGKAGLEEARRAIGMLRDDDLPGPERLPALVRDFQRDTGVPCRIELSGEERTLPSVARLTLYRVAQEALTNVRRHAQARSVEVRLAYETEGTRLTVEDVAVDGAATAAAAAPEVAAEHDGYGITGMRERAELLGGRLVAGPTATGFRVELWVPV